MFVIGHSGNFYPVFGSSSRKLTSFCARMFFNTIQSLWDSFHFEANTPFRVLLRVCSIRIDFESKTHSVTWQEKVRCGYAQYTSSAVTTNITGSHHPPCMAGCRGACKVAWLQPRRGPAIQACGPCWRFAPRLPMAGLRMCKVATRG